MDIVEATLALYDIEWRLGPARAVALDTLTVATSQGRPASGTYLVANQMRVDSTANGWRATTDGGAVLTGTANGYGESWQLVVPGRLVETERWSEVEDLLTVVLTVGWRRAGWVPIHAGGITTRERGVLVCAGSMGGKTTFTLAMVRRGWQTLGDDKLLLGERGGLPIIGAAKHTLNVDPAVAAWFPELRGIAELPPYSAWTPKRRVRLAAHWPQAVAYEMTPSHVLVLERTALPGHELIVGELDRSETIGALLRQSVIPRDHEAARSSAGALGRLAEKTTGLRVQVPDGVFSRPGALDALERALQ